MFTENKIFTSYVISACIVPAVRGEKDVGFGASHQPWTQIPVCPCIDYVTFSKCLPSLNLLSYLYN